MQTPESWEKQIDIINEEYRHSISITDKYFDYMYRTIGFFVASMAALVVYSLKEATGLQYIIIFSLVLPAVSYIFGLFYCYNGLAIAKCAYFQKICELKLRVLLPHCYGISSFYGWKHFTDNNREGFLLPYGTLLMFFLVFPAANIFLSYNNLSIGAIQLLPSSFNTLLILGIISYLIYFVFVFRLIYLTIKMLEKTKNARVQFMHKENITYVSSR